MSIKTIALGLFGLLLAVGTCQAGLYSPAEQPEEVVNPDYRIFRETWLKFKNVVNDTLDTPLRRRTLLVTDLAPALNADDMSAAQLLNVSAYLIRLGKYFDAIDLLNKGMDRFGHHFLLQANLGMAYHQASGDSDENLLLRAHDHLKDAYVSWPSKFEKLSAEQRQFLEKFGWTESQYDFYRTVEEYHLRLVMSRMEEATKLNIASSLKKRNLLREMNVDPLFTDAAGSPLRFVGPDGSFEKGNLAEAELTKLPGESLEQAILIVQQLLVWMPNDDRLAWQLGELLNASGDVKHATEIFNYLDQKNLPYEAFKQNWRILKPRPSEPSQSQTNDQKQQEQTKEQKDPATGIEDTPEIWLDRWQFFGVGFGSGIIVALFGYWQIRQVFRRRQRAAPSRTFPAENLPQTPSAENTRKMGQ